MLVCLFVGMLFCVRAADIEIDFDKPSKKLERFWRSTGFSPPKTEVEDYLLSRDVKVNLALIGALPNGAIKQIRIHWLLDLISKTEDGYDFSKLDDILDWIHDQRLKPRFELMGRPQNLTEPTDIQQFWTDLVNQTVSRYINRYGYWEVSKWRFETWNEPDLLTYNTLNFTWDDYLSYVAGCRKGLDSASASLRTNESVGAETLKLGGPAGLFKAPDRHPLCWGLIEFCNSIPYTECPLQYISFHKKGNGSSRQLLSEDLDFLDKIHDNYPNIKRMPIGNDESDILSNWSLDEEWRADVRYAAMVAQVAIASYKEIVVRRGVKMEILSNDNGFLNYHPHYFTQRTLLARFQMNNTNPRHVQFIRKPVYTTMGLLSYLVGRYIKEEMHSPLPLISVLASRTRDTFSTFLAYGNETAAGGSRRAMTLAFRNLPAEHLKYVVYVVDNLHVNPYLLWKNAGGPDFPDDGLRQRMRFVQEPYRIIGESRGSSRLLLNLSLELPSVSLIQICSKSVGGPGRVSHLEAFHVTRAEVLLIWKDNKVNSKCIKTYVVEYKSEEEKVWARINRKETMFLSYHHVATGKDREPADPARGCYRVRAVDFWDRPGPYSEQIYYPG